jgi:hypothetical protein
MVVSYLVKIFLHSPEDIKEHHEDHQFDNDLGWMHSQSVRSILMDGA